MKNEKKASENSPALFFCGMSPPVVVEGSSPLNGGGGGGGGGVVSARAAPMMVTEKPPQSTTTTTTTSDDLPRAHVKRIMKHQLAKFAHVDAKTNAPFEPHIAKDALDGVQQACKIFIHYVTSTANDICTESKRSTLSAVRCSRKSDDINAMGFLNFSPTLLVGALSKRVACLRFTSKER